MFRAFLTDWLEGKNDELESYLNELGVQTEINLAVFAFRKKSSQHVKAVMLVSNLHPGPFLNIGSSVLPFLFQRIIRTRLNAIGLVPHGVSGHELNLVSQRENARIIDWTVASLQKLQYSGFATHAIRTKNEIATATSQIFDGCALVTMTTAPNDIEDVPSEIQSRITGFTQGRFRHVALIDAHNCLTGPTTMTAEKIGALEDAALSSLQVAAEQPADQFKIGASTGKPEHFSLKDGFGPGGISAVAVEVNGQRFAYVNVDGNNMVKGLRELIIQRNRHVGFEDSEVLTTDTHMVNGIVSAKLGYHPIGEVVPKQQLLDAIESVCKEAADDLEPCEAGVMSQQMLVTTLGSKSLRHVMSLVHKISRITAVLMLTVILIVIAVSLLLLV
jgi:putative membrane protein